MKRLSATKQGASITLIITLAAAVLLAIMATGVLSPTSAEAAGATLGQPVPESLIVSHNGLEWVWASPCGMNGCTPSLLTGHDGFDFATTAQWALRPPASAFGPPVSGRFGTNATKCAAPISTEDGTTVTGLTASLISMGRHRLAAFQPALTA